MADVVFGKRYRAVLASRGSVVGVLTAAEGLTAGLGLWLSDANVEYGPGTSGERTGMVFVPWSAVAYVREEQPA